MSEQAVKARVERMRTDEAFRARVLAVEDAKERPAFIRSEGFGCAAEEIESLARALDDGELEGVAGGRCLVYSPSALAFC
ncbi:MAG: Nif11-like leader peptide family RiPP precursor [Actinomycetes bacterium]